MSIWNKIQSTPQGINLRTFYENQGLIDIRVLCAQWIENQLRDRVFENIETISPQTAYLFMDNLKEHIDSMFNEQLKFQIQQIDPERLYKALLVGFQAEYKIFTASEESIQQNNPFYPIFMQLRELFANAEQLQEKMVSCSNVFPGVNECPQIVAALEQIVQAHDEVHKVVIDQKIKEWQRSQALAGNGAPLPDNLKDIQTCIENLLQILRKLFELAHIFNQLNMCSEEDRLKLHRIGERLTIIREHIIVSSFIVEKQPPQVMKTNTRFAATVRWLIGSEFMNDVPTPNTVVECYILSELQAQKFCKQPSNFGEPSNLSGFPGTSGEIQHNSCNLEYNQQSNVCLGQFRNMQLKKIKRAEKKGTESVMDEKFTLLFVTTVARNNYRIRAWTLSLPVVVIVHGNQEPQSWATVTWDNAFSEIGRSPFVVPEQVGWELISSALNTKFASATGRPLTEDNLKFLYEKLFTYEMTGDAKGYVTWTQFCKEPLRDRSFTFWEWFYAIIKITKDQLAMAWKEGRIVGFINKTKVSDALSAHPVGTFLLRFSDSELGGITVNVKGASQLLMLQPWTSKDLTVRSLALRIRDLYENKSAQVKFLYQGPFENIISIDEAFPSEPSETPAPAPHNGYISTTVQVVASQERIQQQQLQQLQQQQIQQQQPMQIPQATFLQSPNPMDIAMNPSDEPFIEETFDFNPFGY